MKIRNQEIHVLWTKEEKEIPVWIRHHTGLHNSEKDLSEIFRHGMEHHLHNGFRRSNVVG